MHELHLLAYLFYENWKVYLSVRGAECGEIGKGRKRCFSTCQCSFLVIKRCFGQSLFAYVFINMLPMFHLPATFMISSTYPYVESS